MKRQCIIACLFFFAIYAKSQTPEQTITKLHKDNDKVVEKDCNSGKGMIITNKALNLFFADKIGSYLSEGGDLSLFQNYATLSSTDGKFSINHNFKQTGTEGRISGLTTIGAKVNIGDAFATVFANKKFSNELGITFKQTWIGKGMVSFDKCVQTQAALTASPGQKQTMDKIRAGLISQYTNEIRKKEKEINDYADSIKQSDVPKQNIDAVKKKLREEAYADLSEEYEQKFAAQQSAKMTEKVYNVVKVGWTSLSVFIPVTAKKYSVAPLVTSIFADKQNYPLDISFSHSIIWESSKHGRLFVNFGAGLTLNNSVLTEDVTKTTLQDYKSLGGLDTLHYAQLSSDDAYIGNYSNFLTPSLKGQLVFFPKGWNVGVSLQADQSFGSYNPLNGKIGIPIRLNDKDGEPTVNFEIQWKFADLSNHIMPDKKFGDKMSIGLSVGLPFSSILY